MATGIKSPLTDDYKQEILRQTGTASLHRTITKSLPGATPNWVEIGAEAPAALTPCGLASSP
jgi:hypothetical protein